jgi:pimeloyl-ACP methyl ester carboxylesterase
MSNSSQHIYCISGLGADEKAFTYLNIAGYTLKHVNWITPHKRESLQSYALRLAEQITEPSPIILGLSFGGMLAIEMAKHIPTEKIILLSTVKTYSEIPRWMRWAGNLKLNKWIPVKSNWFTVRANDWRLGIETASEKAFVDYHRKKLNQEQVNWAVDKILNWRNNWVPEGAFHIHGDKDQTFPLKNIKPTHVIRNGTHIMVLNKAAEISQCIEQILSA